METLVLDVRLDGHTKPIGALRRDKRGEVSFAYAPDYLAKPEAVPLSLSLPLDGDLYGDVIVRPFFDNLLQERSGALEDVMARHGLSRGDIAGLLFHIGKDCAGALSVLPAGAPPVKMPGIYERDYAAITSEKLAAIVKSLHERRRLPEGTNDPSPLAGVQSKIGLTLLPDGRLAEPLPGSGAPTTHILKVPDLDHPQDAVLEAVAMTLSSALGFETAETEAIPFGDVRALLVRRFDRALDEQGRVIRIHQEDFAQALGLPAALKYERRGEGERRFDVRGICRILDSVQNPARDRETFIRATLFDLMLGNADGHAKNFALLYEGGRNPRLAPRYDILPTRLDPVLTDELPYRIGNACALDEIKAEDFDAFLLAIGISSTRARQRIRDEHTITLAYGLAESLDALQKLNLKRLADLIASNIRQLLGAFGLPVPDAAQNRDAFVSRGGGWLNS